MPLDRLHLFFYGLCPSAELHYTNCVPDFCWFFFFGGTFGGLCPLIACIVFNGLCFFLFFGGTPLHKLCTWHLLIFFSAELSIQTYGSAELNITKCIVASADWMVFPRISADFFFRRNSTSQNVRLSSADLYGFSAEVHKFSNRASLQHFLWLACYWPSCNGCNGRGLEWAWISGHWIQSMPRLIDGLQVL